METLACLTTSLVSRNVCAIWIRSTKGQLFFFNPIQSVQFICRYKSKLHSIANIPHPFSEPCGAAEAVNAPFISVIFTEDIFEKQSWPEEVCFRQGQTWYLMEYAQKYYPQPQSITAHQEIFHPAAPFAAFSFKSRVTWIRILRGCKRLLAWLWEVNFTWQLHQGPVDLFHF